MCDAVFREMRTVERARTWTLGAMARFWVAVVMRQPASLREALEEAYGGRGGYELIESGRSSFFERSQTLRWEFFREIFERFVASIVPECPQVFEHELRARLGEFPEVWAVDGSGLDRVAKRLKAVRELPEVVIPGSVLVFYDLFRGLPRAVHFHEKLLGGEAKRLRETADDIPAGTLIVADRGFSSVRLLDALGRRGIHALIRMRSNVVARDVVEIARHDDEGCAVRERLVTLGEGRPQTPRTRVRMIEKTLADGATLRLATTVLDPERLPAHDALGLYRRRWAVERLFQDLKQVLNLRRFYAANTNAVAMQLYASAIAYCGLRAAQSHVARRHRLRPEELSTRRLFPRVAAAHFRLVEKKQDFEEIRAANPAAALAEPDWSRQRICRVRLSHLLVRHRNGPRRRRGYSRRAPLMISLQRFEQRRRPRGRDP
jgi:hypothetical protein